jgi:hypothetical protein
VERFDRADTLDAGQFRNRTTGQMGEASVFVQKFLGQLDNVATANAGPQQDGQNLGIRQRINPSLEKFFAGFLLIR